MIEFILTILVGMCVGFASGSFFSSGISLVSAGATADGAVKITFSLVMLSSWIAYLFLVATK